MCAICGSVGSLAAAAAEPARSEAATVRQNLAVISFSHGKLRRLDAAVRQGFPKSGLCPLSTQNGHWPNVCFRPNADISQRIATLTRVKPDAGLETESNV